MDSPIRLGEKFQKLVDIMDTLRGEQGCPWDKEQDETSIVNYFLEEVYEAADAVMKKNDQALKEELGDVLMEVVFLSRIYKEKKSFGIEDVIEGINRKMVRRHPHVFGPGEVESSEKVVENWNKQKDNEKARTSVLDGIAGNLPALLEAFQIGQRVSLRGFDWEQPGEVLNKVKEEIEELEGALQKGEKEDIFGEMGDLLFSLVNLSRHLGVNPEMALRLTSQKFTKRFALIEKRLKEQGKASKRISLDELDALWDEAKREVF
jgi:tetrapyrrole methylase family protein/MazG family protein